MKRFLKKILVFSIPLFLYVGIVLSIDPYDVIHEEEDQKINELESEISLPLNYPLYKLSNFTNNPTEIILLGDSRTDAIKTTYFDEVSGKKSSNLAYGGGTLPEIIESFWHVANSHKLKEVYIGINFNLYNEHNHMNRVKESQDLLDSPLSYIFSKPCFKSTFLILKGLIFNENAGNLEKPNLNKEEFWQYNLKAHPNNFYRIRNYPEKYFKQLVEISEYCQENQIKLILFTPPTHIDLQAKIKEFDLVSEELRFKQDLSKLAPYYDFDYPNEITNDRNNYKDPLHSTQSITELIVNEIVSGKRQYSRTY